MKYTVAIAGLGVRGKIHLKGLLENGDSFDVVAICDIDQKRETEIKEKFGISVPFYTEAEEMLKTHRPDIFVFVTMPEVRTQMVELAVKYGCKGLSFEKPMAVNLKEAKYITDLCNKNNIKAVVSHQQKYTKQMRLVKEMVDRGAIGKIQKIHAETTPWLSQLGTHFIDYSFWMDGGNSKVKSVVGHAHGNWMLTDSHPAPDYVLGEILLDDGVRIYMECGYFSERHPYVPAYGSDNRITVYGTHGYVWAETDGAYGYFTKETKGECVEGRFDIFDIQDKEIQTPYYTEYAEWLNDDSKVHMCNINLAYAGYEVIEAICLSALDNTRIDLPITNLDYEPVYSRMEAAFPDVETIKRRTEQGGYDEGVIH